MKNMNWDSKARCCWRSWCVWKFPVICFMNVYIWRKREEIVAYSNMNYLKRYVECDVAFFEPFIFLVFERKSWARERRGHNTTKKRNQHDPIKLSHCVMCQSFKSTAKDDVIFVAWWCFSFLSWNVQSIEQHYCSNIKNAINLNGWFIWNDFYFLEKKRRRKRSYIYHHIIGMF